MLKKLYDKSRLGFALFWIGAYCVLISAADGASAAVGVEKSVTLPVGLLLCLVLFFFLSRNGLLESYGLCRPRVSHRKMLFYLPLILMLSVNLWYGVSMPKGALSAVLSVLSMLCVGFLEEVIFRGLLFGAMREGSLKAAVAVSSVTFGIGHIVNLVNGSGAELLPSLLQVVYATAAGFMFVMIYYRSESLLACIGAHGIFNALGVFANEAAATPKTRILFALALTVITAGYGVYLACFPAKKGGEQ